MKKLIILALLGIFLTSCSFFTVHKVPVEQGNYMNPGMVNRLHPGMSKEQVKAIMGEPILINIINSRLASYVYTYQVGGEDRSEKKVTLNFRDGVLQSIQRQGV